MTGRWQYWDNNESIQPLAWARVLIYDLEPGNVLDYKGYATTDTNGYFTSAPILNDDGPGEDGLDIVVFITAWNPGKAVVLDSTGYTYTGSTSVYADRPDGTLDIGTWRVPYNVRGAWMIFSYHNGLVAGWNYIKTQTSYEMSMVTARWPFQTWPHYHPGGEIHLPSWAAWWPDIILHEYGHYVMYSLYGFIPPSMEDHWFSTVSNSTTAWAEGWADFFPLVVFNDPVFTWSNGTHYADINLETPHWCSAGWDDGDEVEGRVAGALWDIFDPSNDTYDTFSYGFSHIWNLLSTQTDNTFKEFWQAWNTSGYPKQPALMAIFQNSIDYRGGGDVNADGLVDSTDLSIMGSAWESQKGYANWDQRADLNYDTIIDGLDLTILGMHWGQYYDP